MSEVIVVDYDPAWPDRFDELRVLIWPAVADVAISIEHVGSTAVPGLAAKPVIDLDVVAIPDNLAPCIDRLTALGYAHRGDLGIPGRDAFRPPPGLAKHHLYLCPVGSPALANHVAVRDHLRADPSAVLAYGRLKKELARKYAGDIDGYIAGKTEFLVDILRKSGFDRNGLSEIIRLNTNHA